MYFFAKNFHTIYEQNFSHDFIKAMLSRLCSSYLFFEYMFVFLVAILQLSCYSVFRTNVPFIVYSFPAFPIIADSLLLGKFF